MTRLQSFSSKISSQQAATREWTYRCVLRIQLHVWIATQDIWSHFGLVLGVSDSDSDIDLKVKNDTAVFRLQ